MVHTSWVIRGVRLFVTQRRPDLQMLRIGPQEIVNLIDRILHRFSLRVHNSADGLIVMRTKKLERACAH